MMIWIEIVTAAIIAVAVFVTALFRLKAEHMGGDATAVRIGAALQGLLFGSAIAFVMLPLRMQLMANGAPPPRSFSAWFIALGIIWFVRSGVMARMPLIGHPFRAYRLASLRQSVSVAEARITRLEALDRPKDGAATP